LDLFNRKSGRTTLLLYVCLIALLAISMVQSIHVCNLQAPSFGVNNRGGEASPAGSSCPICLVVQSVTVALISIIVFSPSLRRDFVATFQPFRFIDLPTSFQLLVRPPPVCY